MVLQTWINQLRGVTVWRPSLRNRAALAQPTFWGQFRGRRTAHLFGDGIDSAIAATAEGASLTAR